MGAQIAAYVLGSIALAAAVALVVLFFQLNRDCEDLEQRRRRRDDADELRCRVDARNMMCSAGGAAVRRVWQTANILRKDGFGAAVRSSIEDIADWVFFFKQKTAYEIDM